MRSEARMSDFESLMWRLEVDPHLASGFAGITMLDSSPDLGLLRSRLAEAARHIPQLRRRAVAPLGRLSPPEWHDDPDFTIDHHLRVVELDGEADEATLCVVAVELNRRPFDRDRPLWEFVVISGLADGRTALLQRLHHTIADGIGSVRLSERYLDVERHPAQPRDPEALDRRSPPAAGPSLLGPLPAMARTLAHTVGRHTTTAVGAAGALGDLAVHPTRWVDVAHGSVDATLGTARALGDQLALRERRRSPLWTDRSTDYHLALLRVPLERVRRSAHRLGGSVNDLFVAAAAGGAGAYHRELGHPVDELQMAMPVSTRADRSAAGNSFGMTRVAVPTTADAKSRFTLVHDRLRASGLREKAANLDSLAGLASLLPTTALSKLARHQVGRVDFTTSNVRGAPFELFVAGARIEAIYPLGPLTGTAFNLTTLSYCGSLDMGLHVDLAAVAEPELLHACIARSFEELTTRG